MTHSFHKENTAQEIDRRVNKLNGPPIMEGELRDIPLADILQLFSSRQGRHVIEVVLQHAVGKVYLEGPNLYHAEIVGDEEKEAFEAFRFLVGLSEGHFEVRRPVVWPEKGNLKGPIPALLIEAVRQEDEAQGAETFFNEDLFEKALELNPPEGPELEKPSPLKKVQEQFPEIHFALLLNSEGEMQESVGEGEVEELSGFVSYGIFQLREVGSLLGMGELKGFAISGRKKLYAGIIQDNTKVMALAGRARKGLLWWNKKLLEVIEPQKG